MLSEMLHMFRDLLQRCVLPVEWYQMRHLQHKLFIKHLRFSYALITKQFSGKLNVVMNGKNNVAKRNVKTENDEHGKLSSYDNWEGKFVPEIWLECMLTAVAVIKSLMVVSF